MHPIVRIAGIAVVFIITTLAWFVLGGIMMERTSSQTRKLEGRVADLWGNEQIQRAPTFTRRWTTPEEQVSTEMVDGQQKTVRKQVNVPQQEEMSPSSSDIDVDLKLDQRLKGLMWYALYDVGFKGRWVYTHERPERTDLHLGFDFPNAMGLYDDFRFVVDGKDMARTLRPNNGQLSTMVPVEPGQEVVLEVSYKSRGMDNWRYEPAQGVANLEDFSLAMTTDFDKIDFPPYTMSPSSRSRTEGGWALGWDFKQVVTGHKIGMTMPQRIQPGELASQLAFSAPISLFFFFLVLFVLGTLKNIDIHPINYLMLGGSFFAFHLLFSYSVDHLEVVLAFALSSVVSVVLVVSYLHLVVSARFAFVEAAAAQIVYLIGFSLAYFWDGFTGLTVTVLSILTLFLIMQLTGRIRWSDVLSRRPTADAPPAAS